jgi:hypothetical protein
MRKLVAPLLLTMLALAASHHAWAQVQPIDCQPDAPCTPLGPTFTQSGDTYYSAWGKQNSMNLQLYSAFGAGSNLQMNGSVNAADIARLFGCNNNSSLYPNGGGGCTAPGGGGGGTPGGTSGQIQYNCAGLFCGFTMNGDGTLNTSTGAITIIKTSGVAFGPYATLTGPIPTGDGGTGQTSLAAANIPVINSTPSTNHCTNWASATSIGDAGKICAGAIASGTSALGTSAIASGACATVVTTTATGVLTTDSINWSFSADPTSTTGYLPSAMLTIINYPTANNVNWKVCNLTASSITPGAVTLNWQVTR